MTLFPQIHVLNPNSNVTVCVCVCVCVCSHSIVTNSLQFHDP